MSEQIVGGTLSEDYSHCSKIPSQPSVSLPLTSAQHQRPTVLPSRLSDKQSLFVHLTTWQSAFGLILLSAVHGSSQRPV